MSLGLLAAVIGIGVAVLSLVSLVVFLVWVVRSSRRVADEMRSSHSDAVLGPERATYRGGTGSFSRVSNSCWLVLTEDQLVVRTLIGKGFTVPVSTIKRTRVEKSYNGSRDLYPVLVLETTRGEVGLTVAEVGAWEAALARA
ncbi:hypothetical protein F0U44_10625 [Nocardioides humilatus]|uniref:DUF2550 family protein n=1 Tax=Nocardioides humilatus TaxID=2607660 RepID=A0A5B1LE58_9ACTN|nr:hypothetical protein [Nocardioides humilatus]KAA1418922.1 hypothetical protein F0U44_10625 [Nocardioides humilatus]